MAAMEGITFSAQTVTPPSADLPDEDGVTKVHTPPKCSFRDKLMGRRDPFPVREKTDLITKGLVKVVLEDDIPDIIIDEGVIKELSNPWNEALIIKRLGKNIGYRMMQSKLKSVWKLTGDFELMDVDNGFYMVKFDQEADCDKVISEGPWMIFDHYLAVATWRLDFVSTSTKIERTLVWIRFPGMNLVFYDESLLLAMASAVGKPIKVDEHTLKVKRGRFARVCVEIDLNKPVVGKIRVRGNYYKVEYEGLHVICSTCGYYGHLTRNCTAAPKNNVDTTKTGQKVMLESDQVGDNLKKSNLGIPANSVDTGVNDGVKVVNEFPKNKEPIYGDWLVVNKNNKSLKKGGIPKEKSQGDYQKGLKNRFTILRSDDADFCVSGRDQMNIKARQGPTQTHDVVTHVDGQNSNAPTRPWVKKRSRRDDQGHSLATAQCQKPKLGSKGYTLKIATPGMKASPNLQVKTLENGAMTAMDLKWVSGCKYIFRYQDDEPIKESNVESAQDIVLDKGKGAMQGVRDSAFADLGRMVVKTNGSNNIGTS